MSSVLWYSNETPDVGGQGGQRRQFFQIRSLIEAGHDVTVVTLAGEQDDASIRSLTDVRRLPRPGRWARFGLRGGSRGAQACLDLPYDRAVLAHIESWQHLDARGLRLRGPRLLDLHNVFSAWYAAKGRSTSGTDWQRIEARAVGEVDAVSVCSRREYDALVRSTGRAPIVLPHGIEPTEWRPEPTPAERPVVKLFGNWDWEPNRNGLVWFLERVVPLVVATGVRVEVAGRGTEDLVDDDVVRFLGRVADLPTFLSDAWLVALPVKVGVGAPVKFAEGLVTGAPLLATIEAADGDAWPGLLVSDEPEQWADRISQVVTDPDSSRREARERRVTVLAELSWKRTTAPLVRWVASASS
jgi:glycosyltransferase involved in cell wall biosynthesis